MKISRRLISATVTHLALLAVVVGFTTALPYSAWGEGENNSKKGVGVKHIPPRAQDLPAPGAPLKLSFQLTNTREITQLVTALVTVDGELMNVLGSEGYLNEYDNPAFEIATIAPLGELAYQLVVRGQDGSIVTSKRYAVRRNCLPSVDLTDVAIPEKTQGREKLELIIQKTKGLERDLGTLEQALRTGTKLKELLEDE
jgi:hypothetical protein